MIGCVLVRPPAPCGRIVTTEADMDRSSQCAVPMELFVHFMATPREHMHNPPFNPHRGCITSNGVAARCMVNGPRCTREVGNGDSDLHNLNEVPHGNAPGRFRDNFTDHLGTT